MAKTQAIYAIGNARIREYPFPHFLGERVFPDEFYSDIIARLPTMDVYRSIVETGRTEATGAAKVSSPFENRFLITLTKDTVGNFADKDQGFWDEVRSFLIDPEFVRVILWKFDPYLRRRFQTDLGNVDFRPDIQIIRDFSGYSIGPHADHPDKVAVVLFYLPGDSGSDDLGTSIYVPKQDGFTCATGEHHSAKDFHRVFTAPFQPNSALGFFKTPNSFHGVEPVPGPDRQRDLIQYSIKQVVAG